jgi:hypothetical protein
MANIRRKLRKRRGASGGDTGDIVWTIPTNAAAYPGGGADVVDDPPNANYTRSLQTGIGPQGQNAARITHVGNADTALEYYHGKWDWTGPTVAQGGVVNFRILFRINAPLTWSNNGGGRFGFKFALMGEDGTNDVNRGFINLRSNLTNQDPDGDHDGAHAMLRIQHNIGESADIYDLASGVWYFLQVEFKSSSTAVAADGSFKAWLNNNTYASPTAQSGAGFAWPTVGWTRVAFGFYGQSLGLTGNAVYDLAGFVYSVNQAGNGSAIFNSSYYVA